VGRVYFFSVAVAKCSQTQRIVDLDKAVNLKDGEVEFSADFVAVRPKDPSKANAPCCWRFRTAGRARIIGIVDGQLGPSQRRGTRGYCATGYTVVSLGWQWDATGKTSCGLRAHRQRKRKKTSLVYCAAI